MSRIADFPFAQLAGLSIATILITLAYLVLIIICVVLFIKLATRGIKALDIYISKNSRPMYPGPGGPYNGQQQYQNPGYKSTDPAGKE